MRRLLTCLYLVVAYGILSATVPTIFLLRARNTGEVEFYLLWFAGVLVFAAMGAMGCASVYRSKP